MDLTTKPLPQIVADQAVTAQNSAPGRDLDFRSGSVLRALAESYASIALWLQGLILQVLAATRAATSAGGDLDTWVADYGLARVAATPARGVVTFSRFTTGYPALIPVGTQVKTMDAAWTYRVVAGPGIDPVLGGWVVPAGQQSLILEVQAVAAGAGGNAAASTVTLLASSIPGIDTVTNATPLVGGAEAESDDAVRARFRAYLGSLARGTQAAIAYAISQVQAGLSWTITEGNQPDGTATPAYFTVVVDDGSGAPGPGLLAQVANAVEQYRPLGVRYAVVAPIVRVANVSVTVNTPAGSDHSASVGRVALALQRHINGLPVGVGLSYTRLVQVIYAADPLVQNVTDLTLNGLAADLPATTRQVVRAGTVAVA